MCNVLQHCISLGTAKLKPQLFLNHFHIHLAQTGARQFGSWTIYAVPCLGMDLVILIFFCAHALCLHCEDSGKEREGEGRKKQVWPKPSQLSPRCLTEVIVSDRCSSHEPWTETVLELARNKTQFSRSEETAVLNKTRQRMQKKRLPAEDKVKSWLPFSFFLHSPVTHSLSYSLVF